MVVPVCIPQERWSAFQGARKRYDFAFFFDVKDGNPNGDPDAGNLPRIDPIVSQEHAVTRCAVTNEKDLEKKRTIGRKFTVPYGLYRVHGYLNPHLAEQTGFDDEDLQLLWKSLEQMFEYDRSASRGEMTARRLIVFRHDSELGNAPARKLFDRINVKLINGSNGQWKPPRNFSDYEIEVDQRDLPSSIKSFRGVQSL